MATARGVCRTASRRVSPSAQSLSDEVVVREGGRRGRQCCRYDARAQPRAARGMPRTKGRRPASDGADVGRRRETGPFAFGRFWNYPKWKPPFIFFARRRPSYASTDLNLEVICDGKRMVPFVMGNRMVPFLISLSAGFLAHLTYLARMPI